MKVNQLYRFKVTEIEDYPTNTEVFIVTILTRETFNNPAIKPKLYLNYYVEYCSDMYFCVGSEYHGETKAEIERDVWRLFTCGYFDYLIYDKIPDVIEYYEEKVEEELNKRKGE